MNTYPDAPLTPEERELAQLTARLGPHGEPSPELDARILSAAHAAADRKPVRKPVLKPGPRWPVAMGLAASVVFAVGIAWQLRPLQQAATVAEAPAAYSREEEPAPAPMAPGEAVTEPAQSANADAAADVTAADQTTRVSAPAPAKVVAAPPPPIVSTSAAESTTRAREQRPLAASMPPASPARVQQPQADDSYNRGLMASPIPPPPAPPAPAASIPALAEPELDFVADMQAAPAAREEKAAAKQEYNARSANAKQAVARDTAKTNAAVRETEARALDRVEVTGSRINRTDLQVPVSDDAQLAVDEWLERVRTRYGLGDAGAAKQSLLLFVKDHPGEPIPGDLEPLLDE